MIDLKYVNILFIVVFLLIITIFCLLDNFPLKTQDKDCIYYKGNIYCVKEK